MNLWLLLFNSLPKSLRNILEIENLESLGCNFFGFYFNPIYHIPYLRYGYFHYYFLLYKYVSIILITKLFFFLLNQLKSYTTNFIGTKICKARRCSLTTLNNFDAHFFTKKKFFLNIFHIKTYMM